MKYILKNITNFIKTDTFVFFISILTVFVSVTMIHFSYGIFQNYEYEKQNIESGEKSIGLLPTYECERVGRTEAGLNWRYNPSFENPITVGEFKEFIMKIDPYLYPDIDNIGVRVCVDNYPIYCNFGLSEAGFVTSPAENVYTKINGTRYTDEDFLTGAKVVYVCDYNNEDAPTIEELLYEKDNHYIMLDGELYEIIGFHYGMPDSVTAIITSLPDDATIQQGFNIAFSRYVNARDYNHIGSIAKEVFGDRIELRDIGLPDLDTIKIYNTILIVAVVITLIAAVNYAILYSYILKKRSHQIMCMRLCGMKYSQAVLLYLGENILISLPVYIATVICFIKKILPWMAGKYSYALDKFNNNVYIMFFAIYFAVSLIILLFMILKVVRKKQIILED